MGALSGGHIHLHVVTVGFHIHLAFQTVSKCKKCVVFFMISVELLGGPLETLKTPLNDCPFLVKEWRPCGHPSAYIYIRRGVWSSYTGLPFSVHFLAVVAESWIAGWWAMCYGNPLLHGLISRGGGSGGLLLCTAAHSDSQDSLIIC